MSIKITHLQLNNIIPGNNDRTRFAEAALLELADSIREHDLAQPITVRWLPELDCYQIIAGERRYRAMRLLERETIPAIVRELDDEAAAAIMLAENVARADLDPIDEANAYQSRITAYNWTARQCAEKAGVSTRRVTNRLRLLRLRPNLQDLVRSGDLTVGYAQVLADAQLDANRQMLALGRLRDNPSPTLGWFRRETSLLLEEQAQDALFDAAFFTVQTVEAKRDWTPPLPSTHKPPTNGSLATTIVDQVLYWQEAAAAWDILGKAHKRKECEAAAEALATLSAVFALKPPESRQSARA